MHGIGEATVSLHGFSQSCDLRVCVWWVGGGSDVMQCLGMVSSVFSDNRQTTWAFMVIVPFGYAKNGVVPLFVCSYHLGDLNTAVTI